MEVYPRAEHVWVSLTGIWRDDALPGLLLAWRSTPRGWEGWVISVEPGIGAHQSRPYVRQAWLPATAIRAWLGRESVVAVALDEDADGAPATAAAMMTRTHLDEWLAGHGVRVDARKPPATLREDDGRR